MRGVERRLRELEAARPAGVLDMDAEGERWLSVLDGVPAACGVKTDRDLPGLVQYVAEKLNMLAMWSAEGHAGGVAVTRRVPDALALLVKTLNDPALSRRLLTEDGHLNGREDWLNAWLDTVASLGSRIPPDIRPNVVQDVAAILEAGPPEGSHFAGYTHVVCFSCGLRIPRALPLKLFRSHPGDVIPPWPRDYYAACPHCGKDAGESARVPREEPRAWRALAEQELSVGD